jgi:hypothetical protein
MSITDSPAPTNDQPQSALAARIAALKDDLDTALNHCPDGRGPLPLPYRKPRPTTLLGGVRPRKGVRRAR